jgi:hypothetical protein
LCGHRHRQIKKLYSLFQHSSKYLILF